MTFSKTTPQNWLGGHNFLVLAAELKIHDKQRNKSQYYRLRSKNALKTGKLKKENMMV